MAELCQLLEIQKPQTSPGNPRCNGQIECFNKTLMRMIKVYINGEQREWDQHLGCLAGAYQGTVHESTGLTPNLIMLGRETQFPIEIIFGTYHHESYPTIGKYVAELRAKMQHAHDIAREHLGTSAKRNKDLYDVKLSMEQYNVGDLVWLETDIGQSKTAPKLRVPYEGPSMVWKRMGPFDYDLYILHGKWKIVHHNCLKPYHSLRCSPGFYQALVVAKREASLA